MVAHHLSVHFASVYDHHIYKVEKILAMLIELQLVFSIEERPIELCQKK